MRMTPCVSFDRNPLGLTIRLSPHHPNDPAFHDDAFQCSASDVADLIEHIEDQRPDLLERLESGDTITLLVPLVDPPIIRITSNSQRGAYFNLAELWRWRLLKRTPDYPFKKHQWTGVEWLRKRAAAILADDMGLGKTLQAIAALEGLQSSGEIGNALIVCPKSLIGVWEAEISLWAPRLCTVALHTSVHSREWQTIAAQCHVAIINYEGIRRHRPAPGAFHLVIFDEIHKLKNPKSHNYSAAYELMPQIVWGLSGTPLENHTGDLAALLHMLDRKRISHHDRHLPAPSIRSLAAQYILRRGRAVISGESTEVVEKTEWLPLSDAQKRAYDEVRHSRPIHNLGAWISIFNKLRDICDYDPTTKESTKIDRAAVIVDAIRTLGEKVVVFSWRLEPLRLLKQKIVKRHRTTAVAMITGQTESVTRSKVVTAFQTQNLPFALLCSTRATAEGLTLTAANHVIFLNEWWNPAVNAQARDRVNRIGQTKSVYVYRLRSQGTVESRLDELLQSKSTLFDDIVNRLMRSDSGAKDAVPSSLIDVVQRDDAGG